ncbi:MAG: phenylalanine--tRNA ligase subunit beta, partial [Candidatus Bathyarchaeia archaeon]
GIMQFQDKLDQTYGRMRRRTSIGLYDFSLITPPLRYGVAKPREISFAPLGFEEKMTLEEILQRHPKGLEYGHLVGGHHNWPIFMDSEDRVLSFPPIINSNDLGRVTEGTRDVLIEVTGTVHENVLNTLTAVALSLADRGGKIYSAEVHYPYGRVREIVTPQLKTRIMEMSMEHINQVLDLKLKPREAAELLERGRFGVKIVEGNALTVEVPCYRMDIMHPIDLVEDIAIAYGYDHIKPKWPQLPTIGGLTAEEQFYNVVREIMLGLGFQEVLTFTMTSPENLFPKMNLKPERVVEVANPKILTLTCLRSWLLPSLMEFLSHNTHVEYPQRIFEAGYAVVFDRERENQTRDVKKLACISAHPNANFTEIKAVTDALFLNLGVKYDLEESEHKSFIEGRTGRVLINGKEIGVMGEIHPRVLETWKLENPAVALEISLDEISKLKRLT